jgi:hypothetical protein
MPTHRRRAPLARARGQVARHLRPARPAQTTPTSQPHGLNLTRPLDQVLAGIDRRNGARVGSFANRTRLGKLLNLMTLDLPGQSRRPPMGRASQGTALPRCRTPTERAAQRRPQRRPLAVPLIRGCRANRPDCGLVTTLCGSAGKAVQNRPAWRDKSAQLLSNRMGRESSLCAPHNRTAQIAVCATSSRQGASRGRPSPVTKAEVQPRARAGDCW